MVCRSVRKCEEMRLRDQQLKVTLWSYEPGVDATGKMAIAIAFPVLIKGDIAEKLPPKARPSYLLLNHLGRVSMLCETYQTGGFWWGLVCQILK